MKESTTSFKVKRGYCIVFRRDTGFENLKICWNSAIWGKNLIKLNYFKIHLVSSRENGSRKSLIKGCEIPFQSVKIVKIIVWPCRALIVEVMKPTIKEMNLTSNPLFHLNFKRFLPHLLLLQIFFHLLLTHHLQPQIFLFHL